MNRNDGIDVLLALIEAHMPETVYLVRNKGRYDKIVDAMKKIQDFVASIDDDARFEVSKDQLIGTSIVLDVNCTLLAFTEVDKFCDAIKTADSIDIVALTDGTVKITFGFNDAYVPYNSER